MRPASVLWLQCSLQVWASVSSSTSVGSRPSSRKCDLNGLHFGQRQIQLPLAAELHQSRVIHFTQRHRDQFELVLAADFQSIEL